MPEFTRDEIIEFMGSPVWLKITSALNEQKKALMERLCLGGITDFASSDKTAMAYIEASTEIRMYDEFIKLDELLFGPRKEGGFED